MAEQTIVGGMYFPPYIDQSGNGWEFDSILLDAVNEKAGFIIQAPKTGSIRKVGFRTNTVTTGATMDVRIETVNTANNNPSGTLWAANTNVSHVINNTDDNLWLTTAALTADASVTKGDVLAVVISQPGASAGNLNIARANGHYQKFPYHGLYTGTWATNVQAPVVALEYSDGSYAPIPGVRHTFQSVTTLNFNSGSAADEVALKFTLPVPVRVTGAWFSLLDPGVGADYDIVLYEGTTALSTTSFDGDREHNSSYQSEFYFDDTVSLSANTAYYLAVKPTTATNVSIQYVDFASAALLDSQPGGQNFHYASRVDAGAWTATTTRRPLFGLIIDGFSDGVGGGGGAGPLIGGRLVR